MIEASEAITSPPSTANIKDFNVLHLWRSLFNTTVYNDQICIVVWQGNRTACNNHLHVNVTVLFTHLLQMTNPLPKPLSTRICFFNHLRRISPHFLAEWFFCVLVYTLVLFIDVLDYAHSFHLRNDFFAINIWFCITKACWNELAGKVKNYVTFSHTCICVYDGYLSKTLERIRIKSTGLVSV